MIRPPLAFETLIQQLEMRRSQQDRHRFLTHWLDTGSPDLLSPCLTLLLNRPLGARISVPAIKSALFSRVNKDLFDASKEAGTDLSETLALLWPGSTEPLDLTGLASALDTGSKTERFDALTALLDKSCAQARDLAIRIATGRFKSPVAPGLLRTVLAEFYDRPLSDVEQNLANSGTDLTPFRNWLQGAPFPEPPAGQNRFLSLPTIHPCAPGETGDADLVIPLPAGSYAQLVTGPDDARLYTLTGDEPEDQHEFKKIPPGTTLLVFLPKNRGTRPILLDIVMKDGEDLRCRPRADRPRALENLANKSVGAEGLLADAIPLFDAASCERLFTDPSVARLFVLQSSGTLHPSSGTLGEVLRPPHDFYLKVLYVEGSLSRQGAFTGLLTLGASAAPTPGANTAELVPVGKANAHTLSQEGRSRLDTFIADNTLERFGPVRKLVATEDTALIARVSCRNIDPAPRRKASLVLTEVALIELFDNSAAHRLSTLDELTLLALL